MNLPSVSGTAKTFFSGPKIEVPIPDGRFGRFLHTPERRAVESYGFSIGKSSPFTALILVSEILQFTQVISSCLTEIGMSSPIGIRMN